MSWLEIIACAYRDRPQPAGFTNKPRFHSPVSVDALSDAEAALKATLPHSLQSLLLETDGVMEMMAVGEGEWFESMWLVWQLEEIVEQNTRYRAAANCGRYDRDFTNFVFFAGAGTDGILFAFPVQQAACASSVWVWHPIRDEWKELAPSLEDFLRGWLVGTISV